MRKLPLVPRLFLLPTTTLIDKVLLPKRIDLDFYDEARYFLGGFHVVCWLRLLFIPTLTLMLTMFETCIQEVAIIANQLYIKQKSFNTKQIMDDWDKGSFTYDALNFELYLFIFFVWLIVVNVSRKSYCFVPMHWFGLCVLSRFVYMTFVEQCVRIQNELHILRHVDQVHRDLHTLRNRVYEFPMISVPFEFAPLLRTSFEFALLTLTFFVVYIIERSMLFYGYEKWVCGLYNKVVRDNEKSEPRSPQITLEMEPLSPL